MPSDLTDDKSSLVQIMGAVKKQAITWANADPDLCRHVVSLGYNELSCRRLCQLNMIIYKYAEMSSQLFKLPESCPVWSYAPMYHWNLGTFIFYCRKVSYAWSAGSRNTHRILTSSAKSFNPSGPQVTKRTDSLSQDLVKSRSREIGCYNDRIALKFDRYFGRAAVEVPVKFQND